MINFSKSLTGAWLIDENKNNELRSRARQGMGKGTTGLFFCFQAE
jgi:hypothetical protein